MDTQEFARRRSVEGCCDAGPALALQPVRRSDDGPVLAAVHQPGVELALWRRSADTRLAAVGDWLQALPETMLPVCRLTLRPADTVAHLEAAFDASGTPRCALRQALVADVADLVTRFAAVIAKPDADVAGSAPLAPFDVALFKGCGWTGSAHEAGIVHRSPRIAGLGLTRLVLVLNPPYDSHWEPRP